MSGPRSHAAGPGAEEAPPGQLCGRRAFVSLGSNLGDRARYLRAARDALDALPATRVLATSRVYETAPQEREDQGAFLNQVVCLETGL